MDKARLDVSGLAIRGKRHGRPFPFDLGEHFAEARAFLEEVVLNATRNLINPVKDGVVTNFIARLDRAIQREA